jgi:hypothetical protein
VGRILWVERARGDRLRTVQDIRGRLERGEAPPLGRDLRDQIAVFVPGHTDAPSMTEFETGRGGAAS